MTVPGSGPEGEAGAASIRPRVPARLAEAALLALPVGLTLRDAAGGVLLANPAAMRLAECSTAMAAPACLEHSQTLSVDGASYVLTMAVEAGDEGAVGELSKLAYFDELTGLPNRTLMGRTIEDAVAADQAGTLQFALAFIDIDNFKRVNDHYGHAIGDALLVAIAERVSGLLRPSDMFARIGGDEFVLLVSPFTDLDALRADIEHVLARLKDPFFVDGHEIMSSASIGVSLFPRDGRSFEELRRGADSAMYRAKGGVKGRAMFFEPRLGRSATERIEVEQRLRHAMRDGRLCCAFQPKVDIRSQEVVGVEVLLRWRDEDGQAQAPGDFVGLAVELGLIDDISNLVLAETMRSLDSLDDAFGRHISISLNVAAKQAEDVRFMRGFIEALAATGCAERFIVEVTEEAFFARSVFQETLLPRLRAIGARVSIDDFGVGYSSLSALADITADEIKIDRSFITDIHKRPRSQSIVRAIESLGAALGMSVIVEGVETFEELAYLQAATRIAYAQGYYFCRPMLIEECATGTFVAGGRPATMAREPAAARHGATRPR